MRDGRRPRVVVVCAGLPSLDQGREVLDRVGAEVIDARALSGAAALAACREADAIMSDYFNWTAEAICELERCRVICQFGVGLDQIDLAAASARGILVTHTPEYCVEELAEHTLALMLAASRNIARYDRSVRSGEWDYKVSGTMRRLRGQTLAVIGFGHVGQLVACMAAGLGLRVIAYDPYQAPETFAELGVVAVRLDEALRKADIISLHAPLTEETRGLIGAEELRIVRHGGILVNTARGGLIDQDALANALEEGRLAAVALDVLAKEPPDADERLLHLDSVTVTPHAGFLSVESLEALQTEAANEVARALLGESLRHAVNADALSARG